MNRHQSSQVFGATAGLVLGAVISGCIPGTAKRPPVPVTPDQTRFQCASAFVDLSSLPILEVSLTGESVFDVFLLEAARLQANCVVIERALIGLEGQEEGAALRVDRWACAGKEIQDAILDLTATGHSLVQQATVVTSTVDDYCKADPIGCISVGTRLTQAGNQVQASLQSLARSSSQAGRVSSQALSSNQEATLK